MVVEELALPKTIYKDVIRKLKLPSSYRFNSYSLREAMDPYWYNLLIVSCQTNSMSSSNSSGLQPSYASPFIKPAT
jgi:hypothetical protein